ncbi:ATP-binding cassette domain-containing protein [Alicyclobacillus fastidiosus]|uniref:ATP-binding cassette domain-containing protein n=1 Tax=Alicyclobacillus fastidiosus TaxID=392011 RepID=A0ABY6ZEV6_9BACL|nr:ATP-binding cassette domain-containing protein [Alicyclobacillus fastidiosus]WAH40670.1 ATP-binding cassette domain-containing protein [Alicyclobacillus fastidiosus]GMA62132.1 sugar ABC transporter ATP-binding protein [Alicyclobacillus fastidiosus]
MSKRAPLLQVSHIKKKYGAIEALRDVDFNIYPGEVIGLVGDNGAGKSTTIRMLSGVEEPDEGQIIFEGKPVSIKGPLESQKLGIETVYQDLALALDLDVASNLFLGREECQTGWRGKFGFLNKKQMVRKAEESLVRMNVQIKDLKQKVGELSGGQRQSIAIARATSRGAKLILLDEPTAALGVQESAKVLELIQKLKSEGVAVILISHTMPHVLEVTDRVVVLRRGQVSGILTTKDTTLEEIVQYITGAKTQIIEQEGATV